MHGFGFGDILCTIRCHDLLLGSVRIFAIVAVCSSRHTWCGILSRADESGVSGSLRLEILTLPHAASHY